MKLLHFHENTVLFILFIFSIFLADKANACATDGTPMSRLVYDKTERYLDRLNNRHSDPFQSAKQNNTHTTLSAEQKSGPMPLLPDTLQSGGLVSWGGNDKSKWSADTLFANAASYELNQAWSIEGLISATVSAPVKMIYTNERPYGDGQTNAAISFASWAKNHPEVRVPPVLATLLKFKSRDIMKLRFHKELLTKTKKVEIKYYVGPNFSERSAQVELKEDFIFPGTFVGEWETDIGIKWGDVFASHPIWVRPLQKSDDVYKDWFPIDFRYPAYNQTELMKEAAEAGVAYDRNGKSVWDPDSMTSQRDAKGKTSFEKLYKRFFTDKQYPEGMNQETYTPPNVHAWLPHEGKILLTAVGMGWTWVYDYNKSNPRANIVPFKNLYTCFEERNSLNESTGLGAYAQRIMEDPSQQGARQGRDVLASKTVPSGGGWHEIGDPAETILNNLEKAPVIAGFATGLPYPKTPTGSFSYELSDVASVRWLKPGEGLVTPAGDQTLREDQSHHRAHRGNGDSGGRNYHWFYFQSAERVCTQEWVHNCVPKPGNNLGLKCPQ